MKSHHLRHNIKLKTYLIRAMSSLLCVWRFNSKTLRFPPRWIHIKETAQSILHFSGHQAIFDLQQLHYNKQAPTSSGAVSFLDLWISCVHICTKIFVDFFEPQHGLVPYLSGGRHGKKVSYLPRIRLDKAMWFSIPALLENQLTQ